MDAEPFDDLLRRLTALAHWLQQESDELLYTPDGDDLDEEPWLLPDVLPPLHGLVEGRQQWDLRLIAYLLGVAESGGLPPPDRDVCLVEGTEADLLACGQLFQHLLARQRCASPAHLLAWLQLGSCGTDLGQEIRQLAGLWRHRRGEGRDA